MKKMCGVVWCYTGPLEKAEEVFAPIRQFGPPALDFVGPLPHPALQSMFDALYPHGLQWYWRADWVNELSEEAIALHVKYGSQLPTMHSTMHLYPISGAPQRVGKNDTAFSYRDANWGMVIVGVDPDPANNERNDRLGEGVFGSAASLLRRRRVHQHDHGRGPGAGQSGVSG